MAENIASLIEDDTKTAAGTEYDKYVAALIEAGEGKRIPLPPVDAEDEKRARRAFAAAANRAGKSPKFVSATPSEDGKTVVLRFGLTDKRTYERKPKDTEAPADA